MKWPVSVGLIQGLEPSFKLAPTQHQRDLDGKYPKATDALFVTQNEAE
jgi:hypothetical protein